MSRLTRAQRYGNTRRPVRASSDLLVNNPDGWVATNGPVPWTSKVETGSPTWWIGNSIGGGDEPIGPSGPWPTSGATMPVVTRATSLMVDPLTSGKFRVRRKDQADDLVGSLEAPPRWLTDPMLLRPDARIGPSPLPASERLARSVFWRLFLAQAVWWGRSFIYFIEDATGQPTPGTLRIIAQDLVNTDDEGRWVIGDSYTFDDDGRRNGGRLVALHNPHTDVGVFYQHPEVFRLGASMARYAQSTFKAGVPAGYLKVTQGGLTKPMAEDLKASWVKAHGGDEASIAVLNATTEFTPVSWSPVDSALAEVKRLNIADVAYAFGMAPETLGVTMGNSATYSNVSQWFEAHRDLALSPWISSLEGTLSSLLPEGSQVEVNLDAYTSPPFAERMAAYKVAIDAGILEVNEVRALEGLVPIEEPEPEPVPPALEASQEPATPEVDPEATPDQEEAS